jgi:hypothetical protein
MSTLLKRDILQKDWKTNITRWFFLFCLIFTNNSIRTYYFDNTAKIKPASSLKDLSQFYKSNILVLVVLTSFPTHLTNLQGKLSIGILS